MRRAKITLDRTCGFCDNKAYFDIPTTLRAWSYACPVCAVLFGAPGWQRYGTIIADLPQTNPEREESL